MLWRIKLVTVISVVAHQIVHSYECFGASNWSQLWMLWRIKLVSVMNVVAVTHVVAHQIGHSHQCCGAPNWSQLWMFWRIELATVMNVVALQIGHSYECCGASNWSQLWTSRSQQPNHHCHRTSIKNVPPGWNLPGGFSFVFKGLGDPWSDKPQPPGDRSKSFNFEELTWLGIPIS